MAFFFSAVRVLLGLFFGLAGAVKLTDQLSADVYNQMMAQWVINILHYIFYTTTSVGHQKKSQFVQFADVFPLKDLGCKPEPLQYMQVVGWVELVAGILLAVGPQILREISNFVLCVVMIGAIYTLLVLKEPIAMCAPATVCLGLLLLLNIRGQGRRSKSKFE